MITEASLLLPVGACTSDRREQIEHLAEMSRRRNVELRIQRFDDGPPTGIFSMVNIFGFRDDEPPIVFVETDYSVEEVSTPEAVQRLHPVVRARVRRGARTRGHHGVPRNTRQENGVTTSD